MEVAATGTASVPADRAALLLELAERDPARVRADGPAALRAAATEGDDVGDPPGAGHQRPRAG